MNPIYAKSIADETQLNTRHEWFQQKEQLVSGVEVLLLPRDFQDLARTESILLDAKKKFGNIAIEAPDCIEAGGVNPVSQSKYIAKCSQVFLEKFVKLANAIEPRYAQYQLMRDKYNLVTQGRTIDGVEAVPSIPTDLATSAREIFEYHKELQTKTKTPLQIENTIPLNPQGHADKPENVHYEPNLTRISDFPANKITLALDLAHALSTYHTLGAAIKPLLNYHLQAPVDTKLARFWIDITKDDYASLQEEKNSTSTHTEKILEEIRKHKPNIGSIQVANAMSFGFTGGDHGRLEGWLNLEKLVKELALITRAPMIPEVTEESRENYAHNPVNQQTLLKRMHCWLKN